MRILSEIIIDVGEEMERTVTLWLVSRAARIDMEEQWQFLDALHQFCQSRGWSIEWSHEPFEEPHVTHFNDWGET